MPAVASVVAGEAGWFAKPPTLLGRWGMTVLVGQAAGVAGTGKRGWFAKTLTLTRRWV